MATALGVRVTNTLNNTSFDRVFPRLPVRIGRNALNDLPLEFGFVSQFHAVLEDQGGRLLLRDLGSTNGTILKAGRVPPNQAVDLAEHGFEFGIVHLTFRTYSVQAEAPAPSAPKNMLRATSFLRPGAALPMPMPGSVPPPAQTFEPRIAQLRTNYDASMSAFGMLMEGLARALTEIPAESRNAFISQVVANFPALEHEPEFRQLAQRHGLNVGSSQGGGTQELALQALREMAAQYTPSIGAPRTPDDLARFINKVNETLSVFFNCFIPLRDGYRQFETDLALRNPQRTGGSDVHLAIETAKTAQDLANRLLDWRDPYYEGNRAIEALFADVMIHQVALLNGVMMGVRSLLSELSPGEIEKAADDPKHKAGLFESRQKLLWKIFEQRHADLAEDEKRMFSLLFGREFGQAYRGMSKPPPGEAGSGSFPSGAKAGSNPPMAPLPNPNAPYGGTASHPQYSRPSKPPGQR